MTEQANAITIDALAAGGAGVGRLPDGMTVFVQRTAPGDQLLLGDVHRRRRFATAELRELVWPGPDRVAPPCPHFTRDHCGGCQWQHLTYDAQRAAKARIVGDALRRIGKLDLADPEVVASPRAYGYRATITLTVRHSASRTIAGFHDFEDPARIFQLDTCHIAREEVDALWRAVRPALAHLPQGDDVRLKLRVAAHGALHLIVDGGGEAWTDAPSVHGAIRRAGFDATVWWRPSRGALRRMAGPERDAGAASFAQVNPEVAGLLRGTVVDEAAAAARRLGGKAARVLDLYGGVGETALPLAQAGHDVTLVELDERAVRQAEKGAVELGVTLRCVAARVEDVVAKLLPADVAIVNPPRAGLAQVVAGRLAAYPPSRLLYVSCDPATLARDLQRLAAGTRPTFRSFDMFPQSSHVETLAIVDWIGA